jgi:hypothetical protein
MKTLDDYLDYIEPQHRAKPRFEAVVINWTRHFVDLQAFYASLIDGFDLDKAVGVQLDQIGLWIGRSREINLAITNFFFSWDTDGLGWDEGYWQGLFDSDTGIFRLDDRLYRLVLRGKIAANSWDGTLPDMKRVYEQVFRDTGISVVVSDNQDMTATVTIRGAADPVTLAIIQGGYIPLKPMAVSIKYIAA